MDDEVIKKMVLQLGGKEVELTVGEAKKLHEALNELFERKAVTVEERHIHHDYPWRWWGYYQPTTITTAPTYPYTVWYANNGVAFNYDSQSSTLMCAVS